MVESASLLKKCRSDPTKGSNPLLSATCMALNRSSEHRLPIQGTKIRTLGP